MKNIERLYTLFYNDPEGDLDNGTPFATYLTTRKEITKLVKLYNAMEDEENFWFEPLKIENITSAIRTAKKELTEYNIIQSQD